MQNSGALNHKPLQARQAWRGGPNNALRETMVAVEERLCSNGCEPQKPASKGVAEVE